MADTTRLELATSAVTGRRSNQLSYMSTIPHIIPHLPRLRKPISPHLCYNIYYEKAIHYHHPRSSPQREE